jgi:hypothetical protein
VIQQSLAVHHHDYDDHVLPVMVLEMIDLIDPFQQSSMFRPPLDTTYWDGNQ